MKKILPKLDYLILFVLLIIGAYLRIDGILTGDFPFLYDNGRDLLEVKKIFVDHKLTLIGPFSGLQGVFQSPLWFYLLGIPFLLGGGSPLAMMIFMVVLGLLAIVMAYFVGKEIFGRSTGLILALLFTISPSVVFLSRIAWHPYLVVYLMLPLYFCIFRAIKGNKNYWFAAGFIAGVIAQFEIAFGLFLLPVIILTFLLFQEKTKLKFLFGGIALFFFNFLPQVLFDLRHNFLMTRSVLGFLSGQERGLGVVVPFPDRFFHRLNELKWNTINSVSQNDLFVHLFFLIVIIYIVFLLVRREKEELKTAGALILTPLVFFVSFLVYPYIAWSHYWIGLQTAYLILVAFILGKIAGLKLGKIFVTFLLTVWFLTTIASPNLYVKKDEGGPTTYKNEVRVIDYLYQDAKGKKFAVFVYTPPIYNYAYQYLFWWRSQKYGYLPTVTHKPEEKDKDGLFYLIIEPDPERPWGPDGWKKTVIATGKVVWERTLPGDIILERREGEKYSED